MSLKGLTAFASILSSHASRLNEWRSQCKYLLHNLPTHHSVIVILMLDLWLAKDNRFLNPKSSYERILLAPPCRLIKEFQNVMPKDE